MTESSLLNLINQIFEIEKKIQDKPLEKSLNRNLRRMKESLQENGYRLHNPLGERYDLTRLDCEAMISGEQTDALSIVEVIKPIVYRILGEETTLLQKGVVLVEQKAS